MAKTYDLVVIGSGTAASVAANHCRNTGWRVAVIDHLPFGGTCALRGCDPKKVLVGAAEVVDHAGRMQNKGVAGGESRIDWRELMAFKRGFTSPVPAAVEQSFRKKGIDTYHGLARFRSDRTLQAGDDVLEFRFALIAAGAVPVRLGIPGEEHLISSADFLELDELPQRILLVGGGYIAAEFSHIAARAGAKVIVLQRAERMLKHFDPDLVGWLMERFRALGIDVRTGTAVEGIESKDGYRVRATSARGTELFEADLVVHAAGRAPDLEALNLDAAGIAVEKGQLKLNEYLQSVTNRAVYAAGDSARVGPPLTPVAAHDAKVVAENLLRGNRQTPDYAGVPSVAFTIPPIAAVGLSEKQAREQGLKFRAQHQNASDWFTARQAAEPVYGFKVLVEEKTDRILGAHLVGPHADEAINLFALAIRHGLKAEELKTTMFAYPTAGSDVGYML
jgi:glutathione reductase (NADPH)